MLDRDLELRIGSVATDFFLNLTAVAALVALPILIPFAGPPALPSAVALSRPLADIHAERVAAEHTLAQLESARGAAADTSAKTDAALAATAAGLRVDLARIITENTGLAKRVEQARVTPRASSLGVPLARDTDKKAVFFILAADLLVPITKDAGRFTDMNVNGGVRVFNPSLPGDPVASVSEGNSLAAKTIAAVNPAKEFAFIFLRDDSFGAFYQLRSVLQQRGIALGWTPLTTANRQVVFSTGGYGRRPNIQD